MGSGGCVAVALAAVGILGTTKAQVVKKLDAEIATVEAIFCKQGSKNPAALAGKKGDYWHTKVIGAALGREYGKGNFVFEKQSLSSPLDRWRLGDYPRIYYLIDGTLNTSYYSTRLRQQRWQEDGKAANYDEAEWRHCVIAGFLKFHCLGNEADNGWSPHSDLHMDPVTGRPDPTRGYLKAFHKVYLLYCRNRGRK
jgi:hypothetical protein